MKTNTPLPIFHYVLSSFCFERVELCLNDSPPSFHLDMKHFLTPELFQSQCQPREVAKQRLLGADDLEPELDCMAIIRHFYHQS